MEKKEDCENIFFKDLAITFRLISKLIRHVKRTKLFMVDPLSNGLYEKIMMYY